MQLVINLDTLRIHGALNQPPLQAVSLIRGDTVPLRLQFATGGVIAPLGGGASIRVGIKKRDDFAGDFLALQTAWSLDEETYSGPLNLNTVAATTAIGAAPSVSAALGKAGTGKRLSSISVFWCAFF